MDQAPSGHCKLIGTNFAVDNAQLLGCFGAMYYVGKNGQQTGPFTLDQVQAKYASGEISPTDLMWKEGTADWKAASTFSELQSPAAAAPASVPAPSPSFGGPASTPVSTKVDPSPTVLPPSSSIPGAMNTGYPMPGPVGPRQNPMAITGMVLGIVSILTVCCCYGFPFNVAGIVFSIIGLTQINKDPINQLGKPLALTGLILSILSIVLVVALLAFGFTANAMNWDEFQREFQKAQEQSGSR